MASVRRPQYRTLARLLRATTAELLIKGLDENGIRLPGVERRRKRVVDAALKVVERLNGERIGLGNRPRTGPAPRPGPGAKAAQGEV